MLLIASRGDRFAPYAAVEAFVARAKEAKVVTYEGDHFEVYSEPAASLAADAATEFLRERLGQSKEDLTLSR